MRQTSSSNGSIRPRKRLFTALLLVAYGLLPATAALLWWLPSVGLGAIHPALPLILGGIITLLTATLIGGLTLLVLTLWTGRDFFLSQSLRQIVIRYLFPGIIALGRLLGFKRDTLQQSFIALNNQLVRAKKLRVPAHRTLLLLPHCVQFADCEIRVTGDVGKCARCGRCDLGALAVLAQERGIGMAVATGGTLARKLIVERRPQFIVAVACERDLTSGIRDAYPLPVIGILNRRPEGPCHNTRAVPEEIARALDEFVLPAGVP